MKNTLRAAAVVLAIVLGCNRGPVCEDQRLRGELASVTADRNALRQQLEDLKAKARISDEHVLFQSSRELEQIGRTSDAATSFATFVEHYPKSPLADSAHGHLKRLRAALSADERRHEETRAAEQLNTVRISEIFANIREYRQRQIVREVECMSIREGYSEARGGPSFTMYSPCTVESENDIEVWFRDRDIAQLADIHRDSRGWYRFRGMFQVLDRDGDRVAVRFVALH